MGIVNSLFQGIEFYEKNNYEGERLRRWLSRDREVIHSEVNLSNPSHAGDKKIYPVLAFPINYLAFLDCTYAG